MERSRTVRDPRGDVRGVFVFALLAAFAVLSLAVVLVGARAYRAINQTADETHVSRTGMSYLLGKARGADAEDAIAIRRENGADVLALYADYNGKRYATYLYCDGQNVREYFAAADAAFDASYGEAIFAADEMTVSLDGQLLTITLTDDAGGEHVSSVLLACGGGADA